MASKVLATEAASVASQLYARASARLAASGAVVSVVRASSATAYPSFAKRRPSAAPFPGPTPTTTHTFLVVMWGRRYRSWSTARPAHGEGGPVGLRGVDVY